MALHYIREEDTITIENADDSVVLSPSTYWYVHARFPTRSLARARKLADAFMDTRPQNYTEIYVEKSEEGFDCYAYDGEALAARLRELEAQGEPVWFLQQLASQMPLRIDDGLIAETINGVAVEMRESSRSLPTLGSIDLKAVARPFNKESAGGFPVRLTVALTLLLALAVVTDLAGRFQRYTAVEKALDQSRTSRSIYEIRALLKKYEKIADRQRDLRQNIAKALKRGHLSELECTPEKGCSGE